MSFRECTPNSVLPLPIYTGIEIEAELPNSSGEQDEETEEYTEEENARNNVEANVADKGYENEFKIDGSLHNCGIEVNTEPLFGRELIENVRSLTQALKVEGFETSTSCGLHVHLDARDMTTEQIRIFTRYYMKYEDLIFKMLPDCRRNNSYCSRFGDMGQYFVSGSDYCSHYFGRCALNIDNFINRARGHTNKQTVEFRMHEGTLDPVAIINWVKFLHRFYTKGTSLTDDQVDALKGTVEELASDVLKDRGQKDYFSARSKIVVPSKVLVQV